MSASPLPYRAEVVKPLGVLITERREALGWTKTQLAVTAGVSARTVGRLEAGDTSVRFSRVTAVLTAMGAKLDILPSELIGPAGRKPVTLIRETTDD